MRMIALIGTLWTDVILDCAREEVALRKERERQAKIARHRPPDYAELAEMYEEEDDTERAELYRNAAEVMKNPPATTPVPVPVPAFGAPAV